MCQGKPRNNLLTFFISKDKVFTKPFTAWKGMANGVIRKHIIFDGRVQGVGFRYYSVMKARSLGLTGWVKNLYDGTVEMEVQGREEDIQKLIAYLDSQRYVSITGIDAREIPLQKDRDFRERW